MNIKLKSVFTGVLLFHPLTSLALAIPEGLYTIKNNHSNKLVEVVSGSPDDGANVVSWSQNGFDNQKWQVAYEGSGFYSLRALHSNKAMEVYNFDTTDGGNVVQYDYWGGEPQLWSINQDGNGFSIINKHSGKALDLLGWDTSDGANIGQWSYWGGEAQKWTFESQPIGPSSSADIDPNPTTDNGIESHWSLTGNLVTHDPTFIEKNGTWWLFQTGPGIYGKFSNNGGTHWEPLPAVLPNGLSWWSNYVPNHDGIDVWAPEIREFNGKIYLYYSISTFGSKTSAIGLLSTDDIASGNWLDEGLVVATNSSSDHNAIDPDLVIDEHGDPWLVYGSFFSGIKLVRLDANTMKPTGITHSVASRQNGDNQVIEAPAIVFRDGYYYLFTSVGSCCKGVDSTYTIRYGRSTNITGPYLDKNGVDMMNDGGSILDAGNNVWIGPGGQDLFGTGNIVRHAYDATDNGTPKLLISDLNWQNGWPRY